MTYPESIQFLYSLRLFGARFGLENSLQLAALAGNPQAQLRFIHVAGTNGKGSTCAMLESIYRAAGLRVGLYTSPHLISFRERIQVNRQPIPEADVARLLTEMQPWVASFSAEQHPTFFEVVTVLALQFFASQRCDLIIWETGLGGRHDATNIVTPLASVITNIAFDHQQWLGDTLAQIASEKAGIIKPGVPVITAADAPEALAVIEETAREQHAPLTLVEPQHAARSTQHAALAGDHQKLNAALAVATVQYLQPQIPVPDSAIHDGLANVRWAGRMQLLLRPGGQKILLDGAHNAAGAAVLRAALEKDFAGQRPVLLFGALADKKWGEICSLLAPVAEQVFTVPVASERSADAAELAAAFRAARPGLVVVPVGNLAEALNACKERPFVVITGSLYLVGEALGRLEHAPAEVDERSLNEWSAPARS